MNDINSVLIELTSILGKLMGMHFNCTVTIKAKRKEYSATRKLSPYY